MKLTEMKDKLVKERYEFDTIWVTRSDLQTYDETMENVRVEVAFRDDATVNSDLKRENQYLP